MALKSGGRNSRSQEPGLSKVRGRGPRVSGGFLEAALLEECLDKGDDGALLMRGLLGRGLESFQETGGAGHRRGYLDPPRLAGIAHHSWAVQGWRRVLRSEWSGRQI